MTATTETTKKIPCLYCGNNPISHRMSKIDSVLFLTLDPIGQWFLRTWPGRAILWGVDRLFDVCLWLGTKLGLMYFVQVPDEIDSDRG